jgi:hypothetical protein
MTLSDFFRITDHVGVVSGVPERRALEGRQP